MSLPPFHTPDISLPQNYWSVLSQDDKDEFMRLRSTFQHGQKISSKDRRIVTFSKELNLLIRYLERSPENLEARCVLIGVCFVGPYVCVNTRQLKSYLCRCKSSINGSFQQLGYVALRTKAKARDCVTTALPSLQNNQNILRQWTVRYASEDIRVCFFMSFSHVNMPPIEEDDLYDEKKARHPKSRVQFPMSPPFQGTPVYPYPPHTMPMVTPVGPMQPAPETKPSLVTKQIAFDLPSLESMEQDDGFDFPESPFHSHSLDFFPDFTLDVHASSSILEPPKMAKSTSCYVGGAFDWSDFDDPS